MDITDLKTKESECWNAYINARNAYNNAVSMKYIEKYKGQFIKWSEGIKDEDMKYMYVMHVWNSSDFDGLPVLYFEGVYFSGCISEHIDCTFFSWEQYRQVKFRFDDFNEETCEYKKSCKDGKSLMHIITKEEYLDTFRKAINDTLKEQMSFKYEIEN